MRKQSGFTLIEVALAIVIIALIASLGYIAYTRSQDQKSGSATNNSQTKAKNTLTFNNLGVSIAANDKLADVTYEERTTPDSASVSFSSKAIETLGATCQTQDPSSSDTDNTAFTVMKGSGQYKDFAADVEANDRMPNAGILLKQYDTFFIYAWRPTDDQYGNCVNDAAKDKEYRTLVTELQEALNQAFTQAKALE